MDSEGLLALPELADVAASASSSFAAAAAASCWRDALAGARRQVDYVDCYRREQAAWRCRGPGRGVAGRRVDAVTLTSSEGLDNLWEMLDAMRRVASLPRTPTFVPHPRIADTRPRTRAFARVIVTPPTDAGFSRRC